MNDHSLRGAGGCILWLTGLSASGKTTLGEALHAELQRHDLGAVLLDGDALRKTISQDLGFSREDRLENMRRIGILAEETAGQGSIVIVAAISPYRDMREGLRRASAVPFFEVFVDAPLSVCEGRDPKGLYQAARAGLLQCFTGIDDVYEAPQTPDAHCQTDRETHAESVEKLMKLLQPWLASSHDRSSGVHTE